MTTPLNDSITLGQAPGTVDEIVRIADGAPVALEKVELDNMARVSSRIQRAIEQDQTIYG
ncbi:histidine ammonia-lyase, partial [Klebsiella pneumoniae]